MENFSQSAPVNMAPTGIATFAKCPICPDIRQIQADIAAVSYTHLTLPTMEAV